MISLWIITAVALVVSLAADRQKIRAAALRGLKVFNGVIPMLLGILAEAKDALGHQASRTAAYRASQDMAVPVELL